MALPEGLPVADIHTVDFYGLMNDDQSESEKLLNASKEDGFFYLSFNAVEHDGTMELIEKMYQLNERPLPFFRPAELHGEARGRVLQNYGHLGSAGLQGYYAGQRFPGGRQSEAEQMLQAKRRMAAQRERELRNYHQEQQYNRSKWTERVRTLSRG